MAQGETYFDPVKNWVQDPEKCCETMQNRDDPEEWISNSLLFFLTVGYTQSAQLSVTETN
ncbi:hypothetical protein FACS1894172_09910 [Spirochaetia bacterium]|nr:hypothetical protein FACS1894164_08390 [Spirochaetia bacterium]GHU32740.1 hypothetical protein FACS1894172_09910 [Spirochaetia bacterium]